MESIVPLLPSIILALISGLCAYFAARKQTSTALESLKESNRHDIDKLIRQHEIDIDNLKEKHRLELEKMQVEHERQLERDAQNSQNKAASEIMAAMIGTALSTPAATSMFEKALESKATRSSTEVPRPS